MCLRSSPKKAKEKKKLGLSFYFHFLILSLLLLFVFLTCLRLLPRHMELPRLGVESELQLLAYNTAHNNVGSLTH